MRIRLQKRPHHPFINIRHTMTPTQATRTIPQYEIHDLLEGSATTRLLARALDRTPLERRAALLAAFLREHGTTAAETGLESVNLADDDTTYMACEICLALGY